MAFQYATFPGPFVRPRDEYACMGAPPEKEVAPEPRQNGAVIAGLARVLRGVLRASAGPAHGGIGRPRQGR